MFQLIILHFFILKLLETQTKTCMFLTGSQTLSQKKPVSHSRIVFYFTQLCRDRRAVIMMVKRHVSTETRLQRYRGGGGGGSKASGNIKDVVSHV